MRKKEISIFSGASFTVDRANGLSGRCGFLVSQGEEAKYITSPVVAIVEAKNDNVEDDNVLGQCAAEMVAAQLFNKRENRNITCIYGTTTNGLSWKFMKLIGKTLYMEEMERTFVAGKTLGELLGILLEITKPQE